MAVWTVYLSLCLLVALTASEETYPVGKKRCGCKKLCLQFDGNLASVHSHDEYTFIQNLIRSETQATTRAWIGGNDAVHEGVWLWSDGSEMNFQIWSPYQPDNLHGQNCLEMNFDCK
ncbi:unnamed protein product [Leuciscus chuanchicus]